MKSLRNVSTVALALLSTVAIAPASYGGEVNIACTRANGSTTHTSFDIPFVDVPVLNVASGSSYNPNYCKVRPAYPPPVRVETYNVRVNTGTYYTPSVNVIEVPAAAPAYTIHVTPRQDLW
jgi:hypothetical protein